MFWVLNAHNDEILSRVGSLRAGEKREWGEDERTEGESLCMCVCFVQSSVCLHMNWTSPDVVCKNGLSPASPRRCTRKADMAQPEKSKHSPYPIIIYIIFLDILKV